MTVTRNNTSLAKYTVFFSVLSILAYILSVAISFRAYLSASHTPGMLEQVYSRREIRMLIHPLMAVNNIWLLLIGTQSILFLVWLFRVYRNIRLLSGTTRFALIWTIISWIIPVVNWIIPFTILKEILNKLSLVEGESNSVQSYNALPEICRIIAIITSLSSWGAYFINRIPLQISFIRVIAEYSLVSVSVLCSMLIVKRVNILEQKSILAAQHPEESIFRAV